LQIQFLKLVIWEREKIAVLSRHGSPSGQENCCEAFSVKSRVLGIKNP